MIKLDAAFITAATSVFNGVTTTTTTDTLRVSYAELDLVGGSIMAMVERGTISGSPSAFTPNMSKLRIQLNGNGTFSSQDGSWQGKVDPAVVQAFVAALTTALQTFVLGAGVVTGTQV